MSSLWPSPAVDVLEQPVPARRFRRPQPMALVVAVVLVVTAAFVGLSERFILHPSTQRPAHADAIVVLGGRGDRIEVGLAMLRAGVAPVIVVSDATGADPAASGRSATPREICYRPDPYTTQGEAAGSQRWRSSTAGPRWSSWRPPTR